MQPKAPAELKRETLAAWKRFTKQVGKLEATDVAGMTVLCQSWVELQDAQKHIDSEGAVVTLPNGIRTLNPYCKLRDNARKCVNELLKEFHLTPLSRGKVKPPDDEAKEITF